VKSAKPNKNGKRRIQMIDLTVILDGREYKMTAGVEKIKEIIDALPPLAVYRTVWAGTQKDVTI
jgi:hypothetical protein